MTSIDENELASKLRVTISRVVKIVKREVKHDEVLSLTERSTLSLLYQSAKMLPSELASREKVTSQSMSQIIKKLLKKDFITKTPSNEDGRKTFISITAAGREYIENKRTKTREWLAKVIAEKTNEEEKQVLARAVEILNKLVD